MNMSATVSLVLETAGKCKGPKVAQEKVRYKMPGRLSAVLCWLNSRRRPPGPVEIITIQRSSSMALVAISRQIRTESVKGITG